MTQANTTTDYNQQAVDFANKYGVKLTIGTPDYGQMGWDKNDYSRYIFPCKLSRNGKSYSFKFGQSIVNAGQEPDMYDILATLQKYDPYSFENFCGDFGYDTDSRKAEKIYKAVVREWQGVERLFSDILDELQEIQ